MASTAPTPAPQAATPSDCVGPSHTVALVRSLPGVVPFALNEEISLPLRRLIGPDLQWIFKMIHYCSTPLSIHNAEHRSLNGVERFRLHCHCPDAHSLQCQSTAVLVLQHVRRFFKGCGYNYKFLFYRDICNHASQGLRLVGSSLVNGKHYIYIRTSLFTMYYQIRRYVYLGDHVPCVSNTAYYIVLVCHECGMFPSCEAAEKCARRTQRLMRRMYKIISHFSSFTLASYEHCERLKRKRLRHHAYYKIPVQTYSHRWVLS